MRVDEFDYELPPELIAQTPLKHRSDSRLLVADPISQSIQHRTFTDILDFVSAGDVMVFNNSKVLPARLYGTKRSTGAKVELLLTKPMSGLEWQVLAKPAKRLHMGTIIDFYDDEVAGEAGPLSDNPTAAPSSPPLASAEVVGVLDDGMRTVRFDLRDSALEAFLDRVGSMPLPPYIHARLDDRDRYQTVYAEPTGSVAAPTAGLHFTNELLQSLKDAGVEIHFVTLHVGLGTFRPVQVDRVEEHVMHSERYGVRPDVAAAINRAKQEGRRVIAIGTTALRTLESAGASGVVRAGEDETEIFIYPGYQFQIVDALVTNFHLPKSTLLMLVASLMGVDFTRKVYEIAVEQRYRFFSFGDAMFIQRRCTV